MRRPTLEDIYLELTAGPAGEPEPSPVGAAAVEES